MIKACGLGGLGLPFCLFITWQLTQHRHFLPWGLFSLTDDDGEKSFSLKFWSYKFSRMINSHFFLLGITRIEMFVMNDWTSNMLVMDGISKMLLLYRKICWPEIRSYILLLFFLRQSFSRYSSDWFWTHDLLASASPMLALQYYHTWISVGSESKHGCATTERSASKLREWLAYSFFSFLIGTSRLLVLFWHDY